MDPNLTATNVATNTCFQCSSQGWIILDKMSVFQLGTDLSLEQLHSRQYQCQLPLAWACKPFCFLISMVGHLSLIIAHLAVLLL